AGVAAAWTLAQGGAAGAAAMAGAVLGGAAAAAAFLAARAVVVGPLEHMVTTANRMAAGDLTQNIDAQGRGVIADLSRALAQLNVNLRSIVRDARNEVHHMGDATSEIAAGNQDLSARTEAQAANLEQTAASMEQITSTVRNSAASAESAARLADQASVVTQRGSQAIGEVNRTMQVIDESSHRIAEIIGVIDSIAFQTNILALNAAVEAARAGEQGRGFAVVAAEVRALAGRTTGAAREIKQLISESGSRVEEGNRITGVALKTIEDALGSVQQVGQAVRAISEGAQQQLTGISQVNEAVAQIDGITQQNAALVEQVAAAAQQLKQQAVTVSEAVQVFRLDRGPVQRPDAVALRKAARAEIAA
ncbi:MAG: chemotaxis protein, partial [Rubrivivax sp.]|nr:chemotaxis protein [Rubrivivax sp.]